MLKGLSFYGLGAASAVSMMWVQPAIAETRQVTAVQLNPTANGLEVVLAGLEGRSPQVFTAGYGNVLVADVIGTQLRLPATETFRQDNPTADIASVTVTPLDANSIRVTVTGKAGTPKVNVVQQAQGLVLGVVAPAATATTAETSPTSPSATSSRDSEAAIATEDNEASSDPAATDSTPATSESDTAKTDTTRTPSRSVDDQPSEIIVTGQQEEGYRASEASTATKTDTPLLEVPQSIQVVPQQVIRDQRVTRIGEAARNVSGVTLLQGYGGSTDNYTIRGLASSRNLRDGFRDDGFLSFTDPVTVDRVEVLKGPASVLYGQLEPGGVVNYVTKKPLRDPYYAGEVTVGNYGFYRGEADLSGPLNPSGSILYRFNAAYENSDSFRDFVEGETFVAAPVLSFDLGEKTSLLLGYEYDNLDRTFDRGLPPEQALFDLPISRFLGEPSDRYELTAHKPNISVEHRFNDNLTLRSGFSAQIVNADRANAQGRTFTLQPDGRTLRRRYTVSDEQTEDYSLQTDLISTFNTGAIGHELLVGIELSRNSYDAILDRTEFTSIDIFDPVYGSPIPTELDRVYDNDTDTKTIGLYLQDQVELSPQVKLLVGGRFDFVDLESEDRLFETTISRNYDVFSPRLGLVYQPTETVSLYASYSRSFRPNSLATTSSGDLLDPERGTQYEIGIKGEFLDGRLAATLAAYDITKKNVATTDPNDLDFSIAAGEIKSRGIELDVVGEIAPGWNIIAGYALNDAYISEDNALPEGDQLINAPRNSANLWTTYEIQSGSLRGLGFGAGLYFVGEREAELPNDLELPSFVRTDATIFYRRDSWKAALNFKNLFDTRYYESQGFLVYPGAPFTVLGSLSVQF